MKNNECKWCAEGLERFRCNCGDPAHDAYGHTIRNGKVYVECRAPKMSPSTVDISTINEYGLSQKLSNSVRCY